MRARQPRPKGFSHMTNHQLSLQIGHMAMAWADVFGWRATALGTIGLGLPVRVSGLTGFFLFKYRRPAEDRTNTCAAVARLRIVFPQINSVVNQFRDRSCLSRRPDQYSFRDRKSSLPTSACEDQRNQGLEGRRGLALAGQLDRYTLKLHINGTPVRTIIR